MLLMSSAEIPSPEFSSSTCILPPEFTIDIFIYPPTFANLTALSVRFARTRWIPSLSALTIHMFSSQVKLTLRFLASIFFSNCIITCLTRLFISKFCRRSGFFSGLYSYWNAQCRNQRISFNPFSVKACSEKQT